MPSGEAHDVRRDYQLEVPMALMGQGNNIRRMAEEQYKLRKEEEARNPEVLDKWKTAAPHVASTVVGFAASTATGSSNAGRVASTVTKVAVEERMKDPATADSIGSELREGFYVVDGVLMILAFPVYLPLKLIACKIMGVEFKG
jgi:hypothetical protein